MLLLSLALACAPAPPEWLPPPVLPRLDPEALRRQELDDIRRFIALIEDSIRSGEKMERVFAEHPDLIPPEHLGTLRRQLVKERERLRDVRAMERRLLEQQPGGYTAPAPRKKE